MSDHQMLVDPSRGFSSKLSGPRSSSHTLVGADEGYSSFHAALGSKGASNGENADGAYGAHDGAFLSGFGTRAWA